METVGKKINPKKNGKIMTCDYCGSFLHLQAQCWDTKQSKRNFRTYAAAEGYMEEDKEDEVDYETGIEELESEGDDDEKESEAFLAEHLGSLGLRETGARPKQRKKNYLYYMENFTATTIDVFHAVEDDDKKKVLLDTGCVRTVCGKRWLAHVMADVDPRIKSQVKSVPSHLQVRRG